jgi:outer membrane protein TolC
MKIPVQTTLGVGSLGVLVAAVLGAALGAAVPIASARATGETSSRVDLLDETPNYVEILRNQWNTERPEDLYRQYFGSLGVDEGDRVPMTLEQAIALALQNNTGLEISRLNPILATSEVRRAYSVFDPAVFADVGKARSKSPLSSSSPFTAAGRETFQDNVYWDVGVRKGLITGGAVSLDWTNSRLSMPPNVGTLLVPRYETVVGLSLNQPLLRNFGWRYALLQIDVASNIEEAAFFEYKAQVANLVSRVEAAYWVLVLAIENVKVEGRGLELARELLRQNKGRFDVGALPRTAVLESEAEVARREANLVRAENLEQVARNTISSLINSRNADGNDVVTLDPTDRPTLTEYEIDTRSSFERAITTRPELIAARLDVNSRDLLEKAAQNQLLPRLDFVGSFGLNGLGGENAGPISIGDIQINADPRVDGGYDSALNLLTDGRFYQYSAGVQIEVPINNAAAKAEYVQSRIESERSRLSLRQLEENVTLEIKNSINNLQAHLKSIEATRVARDLAEENVRNQQARYDVGLATTKDLIDFQERLTRAEQEEIGALTRYNTDLVELRRVDGTLLDYRNVEMRRVEPEGTPWWASF